VIPFNAKDIEILPESEREKLCYCGLNEENGEKCKVGGERE
jgi:hypothetical protein